MDARHNGIGRATSLNNAALAAVFSPGEKATVYVRTQKTDCSTFLCLLTGDPFSLSFMLSSA